MGMDCRHWYELKLSFQEGIAPGESLNEKLDFMEKLGVVGFEDVYKRQGEIQLHKYVMKCVARVKKEPLNSL